MPLPGGGVAEVKLDFEVLRELGVVAREYGLAGAVQHGASTLPDELFHRFPAVETAEIHLATGFQNALYEHPAFPDELHREIEAWCFGNAIDERKAGPDRPAVRLHDPQEGDRPVQAPALGPRDEGRDPRLAAAQDLVSLHRARRQRVARHDRRLHPAGRRSTARCRTCCARSSPPADVAPTASAELRSVPSAPIRREAAAMSTDVTDGGSGAPRRARRTGLRCHPWRARCPGHLPRRRLGLYQALADGGPATAPELAERAGIDARYAREWLEHQAVGGVLDVDDVDAPGGRASLHAARTVMPTSSSIPRASALLAPLTRFMVGTAQRMPEIIEAYRTGAGIDWADYGPDVIEAQEAMNRPHFRHHVGTWIDDLPDVAARLRAGTGRVADVACGTGWSSISIAQHFPGVAVDGIDIDPGSIERARVNAAAEGVSDRVSFLYGRCGRSRRRGPLRPRHDLRGAPRHVAPGRGPRGGPAAARAGWRGPHRGRARGRTVHGAGRRGRAALLRVQRGRLPRQRPVRPAVRRRPGPSAAGRRSRRSPARPGSRGFTILPTEHENFRFYRLDP